LNTPLRFRIVHKYTRRRPRESGLILADIKTRTLRRGDISRISAGTTSSGWSRRCNAILPTALLKHLPPPCAREGWN